MLQMIDTLREFSGTVGILAFALLCWRLASTWDELTRLERHLCAALLTLLLIGAFGSVALAQGAVTETPATRVVSYGILFTRMAVVVLTLVWRGVLGHRDGRRPGVR